MVTREFLPFMIAVLVALGTVFSFVLFTEENTIWHVPQIFGFIAFLLAIISYKLTWRLSRSGSVSDVEKDNLYENVDIDALNKIYEDNSSRIKKISIGIKASAHFNQGKKWREIYDPYVILVGGIFSSKFSFTKKDSEPQEVLICFHLKNGNRIFLTHKLVSLPNTTVIDEKSNFFQKLKNRFQLYKGYSIDKILLEWTNSHVVDDYRPHTRKWFMFSMFGLIIFMMLLFSGRIAATLSYFGIQI